jgi:hypothetical protein
MKFNFKRINMRYVMFAIMLLVILSCAKKEAELIQGPPGTNGTAASCHVTQQTQGALIICSDNSSALVLNGTNGTDGTNGTVVTPIQFCPGFTQTYPSTFAESGFCINGVMYGVYSAYGGFLAELPPGTYRSDGVHAKCVFTLGPNCQLE